MSASALVSRRGVGWQACRVLDCRAQAKSSEAWPVRIRRGAFGAGMPCRDLWLSPDLSVFVGGVLIPVRHLVNGGSIARVECGVVTYWHLELRRHGVLYAEGLPCESYLDTGNRSVFEEGAAAKAREAEIVRAGCLPG